MNTRSMVLRMQSRIFATCFILLTPFFSFSIAQTCCSSGVPIASNLGFQSKGKNILQLSLALEYNRLATLYNQREVLNDNRRIRVTNSGLARLAYGITDRLDVELLVPYVRQNRTVTLNSGAKEIEVSQGLGDMTSLAQLTIIDNPFSNFIIGGGVKFPTGANDLRNSQGLLLINDLQAGSNTYDFLARIAAIRVLTMRPSMSFFLNSTAVFRGVNPSYLNTQTYKFGNEIQVNVGYSDQVFFMKTLAYPSISLRFRHALQDLVNDNLLENTGGSWVFGRVGLGIDVYKDHRITLTGEYPIYTKVVGTQLSPDYILNLSYYKAFDLSRQPF